MEMAWRHRGRKKCRLQTEGLPVALKRRRVYRGRGHTDRGISIKFCSQKLTAAGTSDGVGSLTKM
jgi:hypothetical protein